VTTNLIQEDRGPVRVLTIDGEAQMNVLSGALVADLSEQARQAAVEATVRAVVVTGAGRRAFCAGANLKERRGWTEDDVRRWLVELHAAMREIERCPKPWIAAINGLALGGGCELALVCDLRVMDPAAQMGLTETKVGVIPGGGGTVRLPRLVGVGRAKDLILTARRVEALEALQIGLVNRISAAGDSVSAAVALGNEIAANAPVAVSAAKASVDEAWDLPIDAALPADTMVAAFGTLQKDTQTFTAAAVLAGTSLENPAKDLVSGTVIARTGNTLTLRRATVCWHGGGDFESEHHDVTVTVADATAVTKEGAMGAFTIADISVGQHIDAFGMASTVSGTGSSSSGDSSKTLDATAGAVRLEITPAWGVVSSLAAGSATLTLQSLDGLPVSAFNFAGTGTSTATDAAAAARRQAGHRQVVSAAAGIGRR